MSRWITQDSLEKYFGLQHQRRRVNDNPNVQELCKNSEAIRVIQISVATVKGIVGDVKWKTIQMIQSKGGHNFYLLKCETKCIH